MRKIVVSMISVAACVLLAACGGSSSTTAPTPVQATETFTGTVQVGGSDVHTFTVTNANSPLAVNMTAAGPPSTIAMILAVGTWVNPTCTPIANGTYTVAASTTAQIAGYANSGNYCVTVSDAGTQTQAVTYTVVVTHF